MLHCSRCGSPVDAVELHIEGSPVLRGHCPDCDESVWAVEGQPVARDAVLTTLLQRA